MTDLLVRDATRISVFRFSAITWNSHRIHYDDAAAQQEGLPGAVVQSHLHGSYLAQAALQWVGPGARLVRFAWRPLRPVRAGERVIVAGRCTADRGVEVDLDLAERLVDGSVCVTGTATVARPGPRNGGT